eukprot:SM000083S22717  [mRNA]  locus=s83:61342:65480:- [translate_table: standard]
MVVPVCLLGGSRRLEASESLSGCGSVRSAGGSWQVLAEEARARYGKRVAVRVSDLEEYADDEDRLEEQLSTECAAVFLTATYGDGEPTDDAARFFKWLLAKVESVSGGTTQLLAGLSYAVFGLGNRQYEHFNAIGKAVDQSLCALGGQRLVELGLGDDDQCIEDDFTAWFVQHSPKLSLHLIAMISQIEATQQLFANSYVQAHFRREAIWPALDQLFQLAQYASQPLTTKAAALSYTVEIHEKGMPAVEEHVNGVLPYDAHHHFWAPVLEVRELHASKSERSCVHVDLDLSGSGIRYNPGDHVAIHAENNVEVVEAAAACLGVSLETTFSLSAPEGSDLLQASIAGPCTLRTALSRHCDLLTPPRKAALVALAEYATDAAEARRLLHLASPAGKEEYSLWVMNAQRSLLEVLQAFPSAVPPLGVFFASICPRLPPRFYSISSSAREDVSRLSVTCAVVKATTPTGRIHRGVCSTWLQEAISQRTSSIGSTRVPIFVRTSVFRLPLSPEVPIIMIGPGTGIAPFRGFLQERAALKREGAELGPALLFYGCRRRDEDILYREELTSYLREGVISSLHVAFSREEASKIYVQNHLKAEAKHVWTLVMEGGHIYVCGDAKGMARDVHSALLTIAANQECISSREAEERIQQLQHEGRYLRDVW